MILTHVAAVAAIILIVVVAYRRGVTTGRMQATDDLWVELADNDQMWIDRCEYCRITGNRWWQ